MLISMEEHKIMNRLSLLDSHLQTSVSSNRKSSTKAMSKPFCTNRKRSFLGLAFATGGLIFMLLCMTYHIYTYHSFFNPCIFLYKVEPDKFKEYKCDIK